MGRRIGEKLIRSRQKLHAVVMMTMKCLKLGRSLHDRGGSFEEGSDAFQ